MDLSDWVQVCSSFEVGYTGHPFSFVLRTRATNHVFEAYSADDCDKWTNVCGQLIRVPTPFPTPSRLPVPCRLARVCQLCICERVNEWLWGGNDAPSLSPPPHHHPPQAVLGLAMRCQWGRSEAQVLTFPNAEEAYG